VAMLLAAMHALHPNVLKVARATRADSSFT
jgi:hypothetical protein